jgi:UPF0755 protein
MKYRTLLSLVLVLTILFFAFALVMLVNYVPAQATALFDAPNPQLDFAQRLIYSARLLLVQDQLLKGTGNTLLPMDFTIQKGETAEQVSRRLKEADLIKNQDSFTLLLKYSGLDTRIRAGKYSISTALNSVQITHLICDLTPEQVKFAILPGMRVEEIAALLPTSGLNFSSDQFLIAVRNPQAQFLPDLLKNVKNLEGYLFPAEYDFNREISLEDFLRVILEKFSSNISQNMLNSWKNNQLTLAQGVVLASIIQREMIQPDEGPIISSVFINRLKAEMKLDSDATVQYAIGNAADGWWKNKLVNQDFAVSSDFNTYRIAGLPPSAICNPGLIALKASSESAKTQFYFFQAKCDSSGRHQFFTTYEEQIANLCSKPSQP